jgi:hypothetical protein
LHDTLEPQESFRFSFYRLPDDAFQVSPASFRYLHGKECISRSFSFLMNSI